MIVIRECDKMKIVYKNKKVERMCKDLSYAKREINQYSIKLHSLINLIENAANLNDVARMGIYYLHPLEGKEKGKFALDIAGRKAGWRLIIIPLNENEDKWDTTDVNIIYRSTTAIIAWEVTNHYE